MRKIKDGVWEYVATYVDDLCIVMKNPEEFLKILQSNPYNFKLKGSGPLSFHLGCGFERDAKGTLCMDSLYWIVLYCTVLYSTYLYKSVPLASLVLPSCGL